MRRIRILPVLAIAAAVLSGCGDASSITNGGRVAGTTLTVYSLLPSGDRAPAADDLVLGEKLALLQAGGRAGGFTVNFVAARLPGGGRRAVASAVRDVIRDPGVAAVIGDLGLRTARVSVPLFDAAGILHVSPGVAYPGFERPVPGDPGAPDRYRPSGKTSFVPLLGGDEAAALARAARGDVAVEATAGATERRLAAQVRRALPATVGTARADTVIVLAPDPDDALGVVEGVLTENRRARVLLPEELWQTDLPRRLQDRRRVAFLTRTAPPTAALGDGFQAAFGRAPGPWAQVGYDAMRSVLAAVDRAGRRAAGRQALIDAYLARRPPVRAGFRLARRVPGGATYEPVG